MSSVRQFADDCFLYRNTHSLQNYLALQEDLTSLGQWESDRQKKFNVAKCHYESDLTSISHFEYSLHNQTLEMFSQ